MSAAAPKLEDPTPRRTGFGYNHNFGHGGRLFHIQTEDSGVAHAHIFTHVFCGGTVVASKKVDYDPSWSDLELRVREMMKMSHRAMTVALASGKLDRAIARVLGPPPRRTRQRSATRERILPARAPAPGASQTNRAAPPPSNHAPPSSSPPRVSTPLSRPLQKQRNIDMANVNQTLEKLQTDVAGFLGSALVDFESGMALGTLGSGLNLEVAAAGNTEVVRAKMRTMEALGIDGGIEDILITLSAQLHLIRPVGKSLFLYLAIDKKKGNLAMARHIMSSAAGDLQI